jgi:hypothetical protein
MKFRLSNIQIVGIVIAIVVVWVYMSKGTKNKLVYYFSPNCPHCVKFMPVWETIKANKTKIDCTKNSCPGIEALPTIMLNGAEYTGERTKEGIEKFVKQNS